jgi:hypothetical protein
MKSSLRLLIPFLLLFCNGQFRRLDSIQFLCSQAHILAGWRLETQLILLYWTFLYNHFARTTQKTQPLCCWEGVFTASLHSKGSYSIVACVFVEEGMFLPSRCLAMDVYSDFSIPVIGRHVTILIGLCAFHQYRMWSFNSVLVFIVFLNYYKGISLITHSWSRALLEKPPIVQLLENFPAFYGTRRSITAFT